MAGIGFGLDRLSREQGLLAPVASIGHGAAVVAGPWILAVIALNLIHRDLVGNGLVVEAFALQATIIYMFFLSLTAAAPVTAFAIRLASDNLFEGLSEEVGGIYLLAVIASAVVGGLCALAVFRGAFGFEGNALYSAVLSTAIASTVWPSAAFCAAIQNYKTVTVGFVLGFGFSVVATLSSINFGFGTAAQTIAFALGLGLASMWLTSAVLATFSGAVPTLSKPFSRLLSAVSRYRAIGAGAGAGVLAIWIDSLVIWVSRLGEPAMNALPTMPFYDSAMFVSRLTMLPGLVVFLTMIDSAWFGRMQGFLRSVRNHDTLDHIELRAEELRQGTERGVLRLILVQMIAASVLIVIAPAIVEPLDLKYQQIAIFRVGTLGAAFYVVFFAATALVLNCGRDRAFLALQALFLVLNAVATGFFLRFGVDYLGFGFFAAAAISSIAALAVLNNTLDRLTFLTFAAALRGARRARKAWKPTRSTGQRRRFNALIDMLGSRLVPRKQKDA